MRRIESGTRVARLWRRFIVVDDLSTSEAADWLAARGFLDDAAWLRDQARLAPVEADASWPPSRRPASQSAWRLGAASSSSR